MSSQPETHLPAREDQIVAVTVDIFKALDRLGHFKGNPIRYAPPTGHELDLSLLQPGTIIDDRILSIMRRLPVPEPSGLRIPITPDQIIVAYTSPEFLAWSRDIDSRHSYYWRHGDLAPPRPIDHGNARPTDMILFDEDEADCGTVVYDIEANTIRVFAYNNDWTRNTFAQSNASKDEIAEYESHYRNWPEVPALDYLKDILDRILRAELLPDMVTGGIKPMDERYWPAFVSRIRELKRKLLQDYKWPGPDFRAEDWMRDGPALMDDTFPDWLWEEVHRHGNAIALERANMNLSEGMEIPPIPEVHDLEH